MKNPGKDRPQEPTAETQTEPSALSDDLGLTLTELSETYAALLGDGNDPYVPVPEPPAAVGRSANEAPYDLQAPSESVSERGQNLENITPMGIVEAMLFVGHPHDQPLESRQIAALMRGVSSSEIDESVQELNLLYQRYRAPFSIESIGAGYRMVLRPEFASLADKFLGRVREAKLAQSAIDILAIVAYSQPVSRQEVERLRGQASGAILAQLIRRDLLRLERPDGDRLKTQYRTTERFLDLFGLDSLDDLPRSHEVDRTL